MYKRKREINALELLKELNEYKKNNKGDIYDTKTLNKKEYEKPRYNTKTIKTYITSYKDNDSMNKEIKKKKNKGRLDLCSHRNKDIFFEVDSDQYDSGNNTNQSFNKYNKNKCSKLLINKITPYISDHYLTQNNINPYYSIKTYNNYHIRKPFNDNKKRSKIEKRKTKEKKEDIENEIIPYKFSKNRISNNLSVNTSNDKIKYPLVISLKTQNNFHKAKNSNLSNYFNDEMNDYFESFTENSNYFEENEDNNKNYYNYLYNNSNNEKGSFEQSNNEKEPDYKKLYLLKKNQFDSLMQDFNDIQNKLNSNKNNYMINNFKKLNRNKMNNKIKNNNNKDKEKKELNKKLEIINNVNIFYEKNKKINLTNNSNKDLINNNKALKVFNEINFELIKTLKNKIIYIPINTNRIEFNSNKIENKYMISKINNIQLIPENIYSSNIKKSNKDNSVINKINNFKILPNNVTLKQEKNKYITSKFQHEIIPEIKNKKSYQICKINEFNLGKNINNIIYNKENAKLNNISTDFSDILNEINSCNLNTKLKNKAKINKVKTKEKEKEKEKRDIVEFNIDRILNKNNIINSNDNDTIKNNYPNDGFNFLKEEIPCLDLPDLSYIRNKLQISIIKRNKIYEDELNNI